MRTAEKMLRDTKDDNLGMVVEALVDIRDLLAELVKGQKAEFLIKHDMIRKEIK